MHFSHMLLNAVKIQIANLADQSLVYRRDADEAG